MTFDEPMSWATVAAAFDALVTYRGPDLLRMKGILNVKDTDKPVVIHGVQHVFHPPATLEAWPEGDDRKSRVVFITRDIAESTIRKVFASFFDAEKKGWGTGRGAEAVNLLDRPQNVRVIVFRTASVSLAHAPERARRSRSGRA